jgi:hypothetical protein
MTEFHNQHIVVTGATSGIGRATAVRLAGEGAKVIATGRNPERLAQVAGVEGITVLENDSADPDGAAALRAAVDEIFEGRIDGVFSPTSWRLARSASTQSRRARSTPASSVRRASPPRRSRASPRRSSPRYLWAGSGPPTKSPPRWRSCCRRRRATSPAPSWSSTAA